MNRANKWIIKLMMYVSSYLPLYIIILLIKYDYLHDYRKHIAFYLLFLILILISLCTVIGITKTKGNEKHTIKNIEKSGDALIGYVMSYIVQLATFDYETNLGVIMGIFLYVLVGFLYIKLDLLYLNPTLMLFGYNVFLINEE